MTKTVDIRHSALFVASCLILDLLLQPLSHGQVPSPITASGLNTTVTQSGNAYIITGGTRPSGGASLFHSFGEFKVPTNNIANFLNDSGLTTSNILGRVTGGNLSSIFGTIQTTGFGSANLFLMNPAGFLFGPNATVNVGGMVSFTSADYLRLADGERFNAVPNAAADAGLSTAPVAAYGFLGSNPGAITVQGSQFTVTEGTGISLVGGDITVQAGLLDDGTTTQPARIAASGGQINIASVASPGEALLSNLQSAPSVNGQSFTLMGNISLSEGALLDVSADAAGTVRIRGGQLAMDNATISANTGEQNGAPVAIDIDMAGDVSITSTEFSALTAKALGSGNAGELRLNSANLDVNFGYPEFGIAIDSGSLGSGKAGDITIKTNNLTATNINEFGFSLFMDSGTGGTGNGGNITIQVRNGSFIGAPINTGDAFFFGSGSAGNLYIGGLNGMADSLRVISTPLSTESFLAKGGAITLEARDMSLTFFTQVSSISNLGQNPITLNAEHLTMDDNVRILGQTLGEGDGGGIVFTGKRLDVTNESAFFTTTRGDGNAGDIRINASEYARFIDPPTPGLLVPSGLSSQSLGQEGSGITAVGNAGSIYVNTPRLELTNGARISTATSTAGRGGDVFITATDGVYISGQRTGGLPLETQTDGSGIYTRTVASEQCGAVCGNGGNQTINAGQLMLQSGGTLDSGTTGNGQGGNIQVNASSIAVSGTLMDGTPGGIFSRTIGTATDAGAGGNISLTAGHSVSISDGAAVSASTTGSGNAGNILVKANDISISGGGTITAASTGAGNAGTVTIQGLNSPANSFLVDGAGSGVFTNTEDTGAGGNITVDANAVTLQNGGTLSAATTGTAPSATGGTITVNANQVQVNSGSLITASTTGAGEGGSVNINAASTFASNAGMVSSTATQAAGGDINITTGQSVALDNGSLITASSTGEGNAGNIVINAGQSYTSTNSSVTTKAEQASGGNITVLATGLVHLTNSELNASVEGSSTTVGGNILIDPLYVILENSQIVAQATQGQGGNINIFYTGAFLADPSTVIDASSQFGQSGTVTIQSPISPASGKIIPIGQRPLIPVSMVSQRCAALAGGSISSFTVAGRDALPAEPGNWLPSPLALAAPSVGAGLEARSDEQEPNQTNQIDQTNQPILSLRQIGPIGFLTQAFAVESAGCQS
jgi:filamentous hemagglutinin family protein